MTDEKVKESRLRRVAARRGLRLEKCRRRDKNAVGYGRYALVDQFNKTIVSPIEKGAYSATLDDIQAILEGG